MTQIEFNLKHLNVFNYTKLVGNNDIILDGRYTIKDLKNITKDIKDIKSIED